MVCSYLLREICIFIVNTECIIQSLDVSSVRNTAKFHWVFIILIASLGDVICELASAPSGILLCQPFKYF